MAEHDSDLFVHTHTQDGVIHKDEFAYALFKAQNHSNIFADKVCP